MAGFRPQLVLGRRARNAEFLRRVLDLLRPPRELLDDLARHTANLEALRRRLDNVAEFFQLRRQPRVVRRLKVGRVALGLHENARLPLAFFGVPGGVDSIHMNMQVRVGQERFAFITAYHAVLEAFGVEHAKRRGPRRQVEKVRPEHVARAAVFLRAALAHARVHFGFYFNHGRVQSLSHDGLDPRVAADCMEERDGFRHIERKVVAGAAVLDRPHRQPLAVGPDVFEQFAKRLLLNRPIKPQHLGSLAAPIARNFTTSHVVIATTKTSAEVVLGSLRGYALGDAQHGDMPASPS
jgi:hypothetical protein